MHFVSVEYALFFIGCFVLSWALVARNELRKTVLLIGSYGFISLIDWRFAGLIFASTSSNFLMGYLIHDASSQLSRRLYVISALMINLFLLGLFKYFGFFATALEPLLTSLGLQRDLSWLNIAVPIGISFLTLQAICYQVDVYRGRLDAEKSFLDFQLLLIFFPKLIAGPLVRSKDFLSQFKIQASLTREMVGGGFVLILTGLIKKLIVADMLATNLVDQVFADPAGYSSLDVLCAIYALAIQLYCDISGYCDLAIGCALLLGVKISRNFNRPYSATSLKEFWGRWYSSLTEFFVEYVYRPMGGSVGSFFDVGRNIILTFLIAAWWHGAGLTFVAFGMFHAFLLCCELLMGRLKPAPLTFSVGYGGHAMGQVVVHGEKGLRYLVPVFSTLLTFHLVCLGWILFKSESLELTGQLFMALGGGDMSAELMTPYLAILILGSFLMHFVPKDFGKSLGQVFSKLNPLFLGLIFGSAILAIQILASPNVKPFIYSSF